jgi:glycerol-3-phosphate O-acyltransferase / dihydroxyacetone phosphate acyltransferase
MQWTRIITRALGGTAAIFQTVERSGGPVPDGPVLVIANHPNSLLDPLVIFRVAGRPTRPLAKAPLFEQRFIGTLLRALGGLPVYRAVDDPAQMHRNEDTFHGAIAALQAGAAVQIYPEGRSHSEPGLAALRTGAARIALGAEAGAGWQLGLRIVPIGLTFYRKSLFRGRVLALIGEPFAIDGFRTEYEADPVNAVRLLTAEMAHRLADVTVNTAEPGDIELIDTAERLYAREKGAAGFRERDPLAARVPRMQAFARGLAWLRARDPQHFAQLARAVRRYRRRAEWLGAVEGDAPPRYSAAAVVSWMLMKGLLLLVTAPIALVGTLIWYPTYLAPRITLRLARPDFEAVATYKLATAFIMVPLTVAVTTGLAATVAGWRGAAAALVAVPALGFAAMAWHDRRTRAAEDAALFLRLAPHREQRARQARERARLTAEFDALVEEAGILTQPRAAKTEPAS